jgi:hypothetical protein
VARDLTALTQSVAGRGRQPSVDKPWDHNTLAVPSAPPSPICSPKSELRHLVHARPTLSSLVDAMSERHVVWVPGRPVLPSANGTHDYARRPPCCTSQRPVSASIAEGLRGLATGRQCQRQCPSMQPAVSPCHARLQSERAHVSAVHRRIEPDRLSIRAAWKHNLCLCRCERKSFSVVLCACVPGPLDELSAMVELRALAWFGWRRRDRWITPRRHWIVAF